MRSLKMFWIGDLKRNEMGRWEVRGVELTCGSILELLLGNSWISGRLEHSDGAYRFFDHAMGVLVGLEEGIRARIEVAVH